MVNAVLPDGEYRIHRKYAVLHEHWSTRALIPITIALLPTSAGPTRHAAFRMHHALVSRPADAGVCDMQIQGNSQIKWPYATHLVDRSRARTLLPIVEGHDPGALMLARVQSLSRHKDIESPEGRRVSLFPGDILVGVLGDRYATGQFCAIGRITGMLGHIVAFGGVFGEVVSTNARIPPPTTIEYLGRLGDEEGRPLRSQHFQGLPDEPLVGRGAPTVLSLGASMDAGKTTTSMQLIVSLRAAGFRVCAAKITGTACRKDPNFFHDAGATAVLDFTWAGWPSTANLDKPQLLSIAGRIRAALQMHDPDFVIIEIADGLLQRETCMLLSDDEFRSTIDGVLYSGPDPLSCEAGVRRLRALGGFEVLGTAGPVANSPLSIAEVEATTGIRCFSGEMILNGALVPAMRELRERLPQGAHANGATATTVDGLEVPRPMVSGRAAA
jgi:hypothetical protein